MAPYFCRIVTFFPTKVLVDNSQQNINGGVLFMYTCRSSRQFSKKLFRAAILQRTCQLKLSLVSNVFEKIIYDHRKFFQPVILSVKHIQHPLFRILQKCQKEFDSQRFVGTILVELSKAYACSHHYLSIAKSEAQVLSMAVLLTFFQITSLFGNKELKLVPLIVNGQILDGEFLKAHFQG